MEKNSKSITKKSTKLITLVGISFLFLFLITPHVSAVNTMSLFPGKAVIHKGADLTIKINLNSDYQINAARAIIQYPQDKLQFVSFDSNGSNFPLDAYSIEKNGVIEINRGIILGSTTGESVLTKMVFRAKEGVIGNATIKFATSSALIRTADQLNILEKAVGGIYTITETVNNASSSPIPSQQLIIKNISVSNVSYKSATIEWSTDKPGSSIVEYGLDTKYGMRAQTEGFTTSHTIALPEDSLTQGVQYHYRVKSTDAANNTSISEDKSFKTKGLDVIVKVVNEEGKPTANATVTLVSSQINVVQVSDENGLVKFNDITPIKHTVITSVDDGIDTQSIIIREPSEEELKTGKIQPQQYEVKVAGMSTKPNNFQGTYLILFFVLVLFVVFTAIFIMHKRNTKLPPVNNTGL